MERIRRFHQAGIGFHPQSFDDTSVIRQPILRDDSSWVNRGTPHLLGDRRVLRGLQHLGFGFLERLYKMALERELLQRGHRVAREVGVRVMYKGHDLGIQRLDMIVDEKLVVETKSTYQVPRAAVRQVYNYLRATRLEVGLLLHFGPEPNFYRFISRNRKSDPVDPSS